MERDNGDGDSLGLVFAENLVHQLNVEVSKAMRLSTQIICVKLKVESKVSDDFVLQASGITLVCIMPIETGCSSPIR